MERFFVYFLVVLKYVIYGSSVLFTANLLASADVLDVISLRFLFSSVAFALLIFFRVIRVDYRKKNMKFLILTACFEPILYFLFETLGISMTSNITAAIIVAVTPLFNAIAQGLVLKEKTNFYQSCCLFCGIAGVIYIVGKTTTVGGTDTPLGLVFMFLAVFSGALYCAFSRKTTTASSFSSVEVTSFSAFFGMLVFNGVNVVRHIAQGSLTSYFAPLFSVDNLIGFVFLGIVSTVFATWVSNYVLSKLPPVRVSAFSGISTIVTILLGVLCNYEKLYLFHIVGTLMILCCIFGVNYFSEHDGLRKEKKVFG